MALSGPLPSYLFPEPLERGGCSWKSLASFLPPRTPLPVGPMVGNKCGTRERDFLSVGTMGAGEQLAAYMLDYLLSPPPAFRPDWARL